MYVSRARWYSFLGGSSDAGTKSNRKGKQWANLDQNIKQFTANKWTFFFFKSQIFLSDTNYYIMQVHIKVNLAILI
jgi:hypothetical protein